MATPAATAQDLFTIQKFFEQADGVSYAVLIVLSAMSLASWYVLLTKLWDQARIHRSYKEAARKFWTAGSMRDGLAVLGGSDNIFRMLAEDGVRAVQHYQGQLAQHVLFNDWIAVSLYRSVENVGGRLSRGLAILATTGSVAPFVGLLGTVWGIYNALITIAMSGQKDLEHIAGPIGEALIMTAVGLFVAVPAVMGYNLLLRRNRDIQEKMKRFCADLQTYLVGGTRIDTTAPLLRAVPDRPAPAPRPV